MAKGGKKPVAPAASKGRKKHGPKKKMFHCWSSTMRKHFADAGLLGKYYNFESWQQACQAKGKRNATYNDFLEFVKLDSEAKKAYFANIQKN